MTEAGHVAPGTTTGRRLTQVLEVLRAAGCELDAEETLDILWLASRLPTGMRVGSVPAPEPHTPAPGPPGEDPDPASAPSSPPHAEGARPDSTSTEPPRSAELFATARPLPAPDLLSARHRTNLRTSPPHRPEGRPAKAVRVAQGAALPDRAAVARALRPLRRRRASRHRWELDESATAAALAESGLPDVVLRPARERWLHLVLLIDDGLPMLLWHRMAADLRTILTRLGAFASVRVLGLDSRDGHEPRLHARPFGDGGGPVSPASLVDPSGRTLVLTVTDGLGAAWRSGALHPALTLWARHGPAALIQVLPPELWESSGIHAEPWQVASRRVGGANASWEISDPVLPPGLVRFDGVPVPVLQPSPGPLADWASLLASPGTSRELPLLAPPSSAPARDLLRVRRGLRHFRDAASPEAYRLAAHLAAVSPLTVPVMRLVQEALKVETAPLAEVFLGGLMEPRRSPGQRPIPVQRVFDFTDEARSALLDTVPHAELLATGRTVGRRLDELAGRAPEFPAWLAHPDGSGVIPAAHRSFSTVEQRLLRRLGIGTWNETGGSPLTVPDPEAPGPDGWEPLQPADPARLGPYTLQKRRVGRYFVSYVGQGRDGTRVLLRTASDSTRPESVRALEMEAEALSRLQGRLAPEPLDLNRTTPPYWLAMTAPGLPDDSDAVAPLLSGVFTDARDTSNAPFDRLAGLSVGHQLATVLSLCHLHGILPQEFTADRLTVLRREVILTDLSGCSVDGPGPLPGPSPTPADNVRELGQLLQMLSSRPGIGRPDGMQLWLGDTWATLRQLVLSCLDDDPARRPPAREVADVFARYLTAHAPMHAPMAFGPADVDRRPPVTPQPVLRERDPLSRPARWWLRPARFGRRAEDLHDLTALRRPLEHSLRVTMIGAHAHSGRATATMALGHLIAVLRQEHILAVDGAPETSSLDAMLPAGRGLPLHRFAVLAPGASFADVAGHTTRLSTGLDVVAHRTGHFAPSPTHEQEHALILSLAAPYYPIVLTDWGSTRVHSGTWPVLSLTDRLVVCSTRDPERIDEATALFQELRQAGFNELVDNALVLVSLQAGSPLPFQDGRQEYARRLEVPQHRVALIPFDPAFLDPGFPELSRLHPATVRAFAHAAAYLLAPAPGEQSGR